MESQLTPLLPGGGEVVAGSGALLGGMATSSSPSRASACTGHGAGPEGGGHAQIRASVPVFADPVPAAAAAAAAGGLGVLAGGGPHVGGSGVSPQAIRFWMTTAPLP